MQPPGSPESRGSRPVAGHPRPCSRVLPRCARAPTRRPTGRRHPPLPFRPPRPFNPVALSTRRCHLQRGYRAGKVTPAASKRSRRVPDVACGRCPLPRSPFLPPSASPAFTERRSSPMAMLPREPRGAPTQVVPSSSLTPSRSVRRSMVPADGEGRGNVVPASFASCSSEFPAGVAGVSAFGRGGLLRGCSGGHRLLQRHLMDAEPLCRTSR